MHLFLECQFAQDCWNLIDVHIIDAQPMQIIQNLQEQIAVSFSLDIIIIMSWCIWMARNDLIVKNIPAQLNSVEARFRAEFALVFLRAKPQDQDIMNLWLQTMF